LDFEEDLAMTTTQDGRGFGRVLRGRVTSSAMNKTVTVEVTRTVRHKQYNKFIKRRDKYLAHDEQNECQIGDVVAIVESRPLSKRKRWRFQKLVERPAG
jgi:small subunit ribosomal protein S17